MRLLSFKQVKDKVLYCRAHVDRMEKDGKFPKRVHLGQCRVGWVEQEVEDWLIAKLKARDHATPP